MNRACTGMILSSDENQRQNQNLLDRGSKAYRDDKQNLNLLDRGLKPAPRMKALRGRLCMLEAGAAMTSKTTG